VLLRGRTGDAEALGQLEHARALEHGAILEQHHGQPLGVEVGHLQELARLAVAFDIEPARGHAVAHEEVAQVM